MASLVMVMAMVAVAFAANKAMLLGSAVLFGTAVGMYSPTTTAWVVDRSLDQFRGRALATMYIAMESGIGIGALVSGFLFANKSENFPLVFSIAGIFSLIAFTMLLFLKNTKKTELRP